jgi:hypothetical protein
VGARASTLPDCTYIRYDLMGLDNDTCRPIMLGASRTAAMFTKRGSHLLLRSVVSCQCVKIYLWKNGRIPWWPSSSSQHLFEISLGIYSALPTLSLLDSSLVLPRSVASFSSWRNTQSIHAREYKANAVRKLETSLRNLNDWINAKHFSILRHKAYRQQKRTTRLKASKK